MQKIGLRFLLPIAVDILNNEPLIEVTYFEGDLMLSLLRLDIGDLELNQNELEQFIAILQSNRSQIEMCNDITRVGGLGKLCISVHKGATGKTDGTDWM